MRAVVVPSLLLLVSMACGSDPGPSMSVTSSSDDDDDDGDDDDDDDPSTSSSGDDDDDDDDDNDDATGGSTSSSTGSSTTTGTGTTADTTTETTATDTTDTTDTTDSSEEVVAVAPMDHGDGATFAGPHHRLVIEAAGGRVIEYSLDGTNVLNVAANRLQLGSTFWVAPQTWTWPPPDTLDTYPHVYTLQGDEVVFTSPHVENGMDVTVEKAFSMTSDGTVSIRYTLSATGTNEVAWAPWEISRLAPGLCFYGPGPGTNTWEYSEFASPVTPMVTDGIAWLPAVTGSANGELLTDSTGWAGCAIEASRLLLLKRYPDIEAAGFAPGNGDLKIWWQNDSQGEQGFQPFVELEPIGAFTALRPTGMTSYAVTWTLSEIPAEVEISAGSETLAALLPSP